MLRGASPKGILGYRLSQRKSMNRKGIFFAWWSFIGLALVLLLQLATFFPFPMEFDRMFGIIWILGIAMFVPLFLVFPLMWQSLISNPLATLRAIPIWAGAIAIIAFVYGAHSNETVISLAINQGKPTVQNGQFVLTTKGKPPEVISDHEYYELNRRWIRGWTGFQVFIYTVLSLYFLVRILRSRPQIMGPSPTS
jgi:hypothetical protein